MFQGRLHRTIRDDVMDRLKVMIQNIDSRGRVEDLIEHTMNGKDLECVVGKHKKKHAGNFQDDEFPTSDMTQELQIHYEPTPVTPNISKVDDKHSTTSGREVEIIRSMSRI